MFASFLNFSQYAKQYVFGRGGECPSCSGRSICELLCQQKDLRKTFVKPLPVCVLCVFANDDNIFNEASICRVDI